MNKSQTNQITGPVAKLLLDKNFAFISTLMSDGSPQVTPTWIDIEDGVILYNTTEGESSIKTYQEILESQSQLSIMTIHITWYPLEG
jgi:hypothetical protein